MARTLYLLRHGQARSATGHSLKDDHARPLSVAGQREISRLAEVLGDAFAPQQMLVSSATRTRETARGLGLQDYTPVDALYNADLTGLLKAVRQLKETCSSALVLAHNPGISWLAASLLQPQDCAGFAPGSFVELRINCEWSALQSGAAALIRRLDPPDYS